MRKLLIRLQGSGSLEAMEKETCATNLMLLHISFAAYAKNAQKLTVCRKYRNKTNPCCDVIKHVVLSHLVNERLVTELRLGSLRDSYPYELTAFYGVLS